MWRLKAQTPRKDNYGAIEGIKSLTMTYFHRCPSTIIGAKAFHCPVREGKEWVHLAMVVKRKLVWLSASWLLCVSNLEEAQAVYSLGQMSQSCVGD